MKKIVCIFACIMALALGGCSSSYERDSTPGEVVRVTVGEMQSMIDKKESFAIVFTQTQCSHCIVFHEMLDEYLLYHNITLYEVVLDEAPKEERSENLKKIRKTFKELDSTPTLYYVKDGKIEEEILGLTEEDDFDDFVKEYKLDEKK